ncbi:hypothetical protein PLICBS_010170 [Purpureocillium lilacinum]|uniref:uncharacterized protein n=1 Tax=Purpureocillium lilacinum TaxID=33203 RepID=UPI0020824BAD|nr:hypothetical protein PLICBS_010170 [Purpureocillium lilacinum]
MVKKQAGYFSMASSYSAGPKQRVRTCSQEYLYSVGTRFQDSLVQGRSAIATLGIHMSSVLEQKPNDAIVARRRGSVQRPNSSVGLVVGIRAVLEEEHGHIGFAFARHVKEQWLAPAQMTTNTREPGQK